MISLSKIAAVEERCGKLFQVGANGKLTRFNEQGAAALFASAKEVIFATEESRYYIYAPLTGLWEPKSREEMLSALDFFLHEWAEELSVDGLEDKRRQPVLSSMLNFLPALCGRHCFFRHPDKVFIHVGNGVLELDDSGAWRLNPFSPDYHSRNRCEVSYCPGAQCPRFLSELPTPLLMDDDKDLVQQMIGMCLTGKNITQSILLLTGSGGSGKGTLANITEGLVGDANVTHSVWSTPNRPSS